MAVLDKFKITIMVDGKPVPEYELQQDEGSDSVKDEKPRVSQVKKYIEAQQDQIFQVKISVSRYYVLPQNADSLSFDLFLDGNWVGGRVYQAERFFSGAITGERRSDGEKVYMHPFRFRNLTLTSDDDKDLTLEAGDGADIGRIKLCVCPYLKAPGTNRVTKSTYEDLSSDLVLHEKLVKGRGITLGIEVDEKYLLRDSPPRSDAATGTYVCAHLQKEFFFEYRTKRALQDLLVLPRKSSPISPDTRLRNVATISPKRSPTPRDTLLRDVTNKAREAVIQVRKYFAGGNHAEEQPEIKTKRERSLSLEIIGENLRRKKQRGTSIHNPIVLD